MGEGSGGSNVSRATRQYERRGCAVGSDVATTDRRAFTLVDGELQALHRFWSRVAYLCFQTKVGQGGDHGYHIDLDQLSFCITRLRYLEELIAKKTRTSNLPSQE